MRTVKLIIGIIATAILLGTLLYCSDYGFEPLTEIAVMPADVNFPLRSTQPEPKDTFKETQHFYVENRSLTAAIGLEEMWMWDKTKDNYMMPYVDGQVTNPDCKGFYYTADAGDTNQHFFQVDIDFDLRYLVTDNKDERAVVDNINNAVHVGYYDDGKTCQNDTDGCPLFYYDKKTTTYENIDLYSMNYCDLLVLRDFLDRMKDGKEVTGDERNVNIVAKRYSTYRQLASQGDIYLDRENKIIQGEAATMNPWKKELRLASCASQDCEFEEFYEGMVVFKHPDIYGVAASTLVDETGQPDWDKLQTICRDGNAAFRSDLLSVDIVSGGKADQSKIFSKISFDTLKVILRYIREPQNIRTASGDLRSGREACNIPLDVEYGEIKSLVNTFEFQMRHSARNDVSSGAAEEVGKQFLARVAVSMQGKADKFPVPVIYDEDATSGDSTCAQAVYKEPLARVMLDGSQSYSPNGKDPLAYWWELVDKPLNANDAVIITKTGDYNNPSAYSVENDWTSESTPKIYLPLAGVYKVRLKVRDAAGIESNDPANTEGCTAAEMTINVVPANKIYAQLAWDKGDRVDMDLYLVRQRECGTMGISLPYLDKVTVPAATFPATCTNNTDCSGLTCTGGACVTSCTDDDYCKQGNPGWQCLNGNCSEAPGGVWACETDADCNGYYCNPRDVNNCEGDKLCTKHDYTRTNDSCGFNNPNPDWGVDCDPTDNVRLDIDDVDGYGPETISIPEPPDGTYRAVVRLYNSGTADISESNPVTAFLSVYISGTPCAPLEMQFKQNTTYWKAVDITWPHPNGNACAGMEIIDLYPTDAADAANQCLDTSQPDCKFANPFNAVVPSSFDPCDTTLPRSIWCDSNGDPDCAASPACCSE